MNMTAKDFIQYWISSATRDFEVAEDLFHLKRYNYCLFFCQLALEKLLKGLVYINKQNHALPIHDLVKLATQTKVKFTPQQVNYLAEITTWNINARYDSYKFEFYKKATKNFTKRWFQIVKEMYTWLINQF